MSFECETCGITEFDLPDGIDAEFIFESDGNGVVHCQGCGPQVVNLDGEK